MKEYIGKVAGALLLSAACGAAACGGGSQLDSIVEDNDCRFVVESYEDGSTEEVAYCGSDVEPSENAYLVAFNR